MDYSVRLSVCSAVVFFFNQTTAYVMRISDCSSDVCSSDLAAALRAGAGLHRTRPRPRAVPGRAVDGGLVRTRIRAPPGRGPRLGLRRAPARMAGTRSAGALGLAGGTCGDPGHGRGAAQRLRSEEHKSELQSRMRNSYAV